MTTKKWDRRLLELAAHIGTWSKDPSTKVGCVIVDWERRILATGYNGLPRGVADTVDRLNNRELKYKLIVHAERNAVAHAARTGTSLRDGIAYVTFHPCSTCAGELVQAGVKEVVHPTAPVPERWWKDIGLASEILLEAGVMVRPIQLPKERGAGSHVKEVSA